MARLITLILLLVSANSFAALEYSKVEFPGCPENAFCQKTTGDLRQDWLDQLEKFGKNKISAEELNQYLQKKEGIPIAGWATEEAGVLPKIMMWDSPCKQHKKEASRYYISEIFRKNLKENELKDFHTLYFAKAVALDNRKKPYAVIVPRGDIPLFVENGHYYFLKEDDGKYYGLLVSNDGQLRIARVENNKEPAKDAICTKEQIDLFFREAPSPTFYQSYTCKDIWDKSTKSYKTMLFGWSCN